MRLTGRQLQPANKQKPTSAHSLGKEATDGCGSVVSPETEGTDGGRAGSCPSSDGLWTSNE